MGILPMNYGTGILPVNRPTAFQAVAQGATCDDLVDIGRTIAAA